MSARASASKPLSAIYANTLSPHTWKQAATERHSNVLRHHRHAERGSGLCFDGPMYRIRDHSRRRTSYRPRMVFLQQACLQYRSANMSGLRLPASHLVRLCGLRLCRDVLSSAQHHAGMLEFQTRVQSDTSFAIQPGCIALGVSLRQHCQWHRAARPRSVWVELRTRGAGTAGVLVRVLGCARTPASLTDARD